jgi:hypothetical protein
MPGMVDTNAASVECIAIPWNCPRTGTSSTSTSW